LPTSKLSAPARPFSQAEELPRFIYERVTQVVARINHDNWQFRLSDNFESGLVENMQLSKYSSPSEETGGEGGHYGWHIDTGFRGAASVASFLTAVFTEIYLCHACSYQEILSRIGRG
jgi:hypothetical protein